MDGFCHRFDPRFGNPPTDEYTLRFYLDDTLHETKTAADVPAGKT